MNTLLKQRQGAFHALVHAILRLYPFFNRQAVRRFKKTARRSLLELQHVHENDRDFFTFLEKFLAELNDSHTKLGGYPGKSFFQPRGYSTTRAGHRFYLLQGKKVLGELLNVDGRSPKTILTTQKERISSSSSSFCEYRAALFLLTSTMQDVAIVQVRFGGKRKFYRLKRKKILPKHVPSPLLTFPKKRIAVLRIPGWSFNDATSRALEKSIATIIKRNIRSLIIDLRGNGGGDSRSANICASHLFPQKTIFASVLERRGRSLLRKRRFLNVIPHPPLFSGKVILLTDVACLSTNEYFIAGLKDNHRAYVIGETTGGSSGNPKKIVIPYREDAFEVFVSTWRFFRASGLPLEGRGIRPHHMIRPTLVGIKRGEDEVFNEALRKANAF